ncbi:MAG TPA: SGNH/GDSL hydrolase family protein [Gemmataceae bacterium]|nr:SGNH/GDSL hydrolase family protein [Gemmataceae bacterium]
MHVLFFGDSICNGQGIAIHRGWVTRLSQSLSDLAQARGNNLVVVNASVNGRTTRQALETMAYEVQKAAPEILTIQFGMNDCNIWETDKGHPRVSPLAFEANLLEIIARGRIFGARAIFLNTNHPTGRDQTPLAHCSVNYDTQNRRYNEIIRKVARSAGADVYFNDIEAIFDRTTGRNRERLLPFLMPDLLHLSEKGHDLYYDSVHALYAKCVHRFLDPQLSAAAA